MLQVTISDNFRFEAKLCSKFIDKYPITLATTVNVLSVALTEKKYFYGFFCVVDKQYHNKIPTSFYTRFAKRLWCKTIWRECSSYVLYSIIQWLNVTHNTISYAELLFLSWKKISFWVDTHYSKSKLIFRNDRIKLFCMVI